MARDVTSLSMMTHNSVICSSEDFSLSLLGAMAGKSRKQGRDGWESVSNGGVVIGSGYQDDMTIIKGNAQEASSCREGKFLIL
jgi:hypothetical protein